MNELNICFLYKFEKKNKKMKFDDFTLRKKYFKFIFIHLNSIFFVFYLVLLLNENKMFST
jgi:hypothetical protein